MNNYWIDEIHDVDYDNNWIVLSGMDYVVAQVTYEEAMTILYHLTDGDYGELLVHRDTHIDKHEPKNEQ